MLLTIDVGNTQTVLGLFDGPKLVQASGLTELRMPREMLWGPSVSVNQCDGPIRLQDGGYGLTIEMQSGDVIELVAERFDMPSR